MRTIYFIVFLSPVLCFSQYSEREVISFLTGSGEKTWDLQNYRTHLGNINFTDSCIKNCSFTFLKSRHVKYKYRECKSDTWFSKEFDFKLEMENSYDWWLHINEEKFYLVIISEERHHVLKLRTSKNTHSKIEPAHDIILFHVLKK